MQLIVPPSDIARAGLRALKSIALADGQLHELERSLLDASQRYILMSSFDLDSLEPITPAELAAAVTEPALRERILSAAVLVTLMDGVAKREEESLVEAYAQAFGMRSDALRDVQRIIDGQLLVARINIARKSFLGQRGREYIAREGLTGLARTLRTLFGILDPKLAARYQALEQLPLGTLGREYFEHVRRNHFGLPGEENGAPEVIVFHDCLHVLTGYNTDSLEETQIASFQAGVLRTNPIYGLLFMLAQFHLGVQITPVTPPEKLVADPALMLAAFVRGTKVNRDLCVDWIPSHDFERNIEDLRVEYNIVSRG